MPLPTRAAALAAAAVVAGACEPADDFTLPWWPAPRGAAPSPGSPTGSRRRASYLRRRRAVASGRGLRLPGARPLACRMDGWPYGVIQFGGPEPVVHGWRTPAYEALVLAYPSAPDPGGPVRAWPDSAAGHVVHVRVAGPGFPACRPRRAGGRGGGA
jgi:hypothetical protein